VNPLFERGRQGRGTRALNKRITSSPPYQVRGRLFTKGIHPEGFFLKESERDFKVRIPLTLILSRKGRGKNYGGKK